MIVTVFRSRLLNNNVEGYMSTAAEMSEIARAMPGYISHKVFTADDSERVTVVEFESEETHRGWAEHTGHRQVQWIGRDRFYSEYSIQVREVLQASAFERRDEKPDQRKSFASHGREPKC